MCADWKDFYEDVQDEDPPDAHAPLGKPVTISCFVDANQASNVVMCCSQTGILIFVKNDALIILFSEKQNTVESVTYGSEPVAMRIARDQLVNFNRGSIHKVGEKKIFSKSFF